MAVSEDPRHGGADFGAPITPAQRWFKKACRNILYYGIVRWYNRITPVDHHKIPVTGPVVIAPTHRSNIDTPYLGAALKREQRFMAKESIFSNPFWTKFIVALGGFPVKRGSFDRETLNNARDILARGEMLVVYPEGARQEGPRVKPIFEGAVWIAARAGAPIIPTGIGGTSAVMPIGVKIPRPQKVVVKFGDPIYLTDPENPKRLKRSELEAAAANLRERLQEVFDEAQILAGTPNRAWSEDEPGINDRIEPWTDEDDEAVS